MPQNLSKVLFVGALAAISGTASASAPAAASLGLSEIVKGMNNVTIFMHAVEVAGGWQAFQGLRDVTLMVPDDDACRVAEASGKVITLHTSNEARDFVLSHVFRGQINLQSTDRPNALGITEGEHVMAHWVDPNGPVQSVFEGQSRSVPSASGASSMLKVQNGNAFIGSARIQGPSGYVGAGVSAFMVDGCTL